MTPSCVAKAAPRSSSAARTARSLIEASEEGPSTARPRDSALPRCETIENGTPRTANTTDPFSAFPHRPTELAALDAGKRLRRLRDAVRIPVHTALIHHPDYFDRGTVLLIIPHVADRLRV